MCMLVSFLAQFNMYDLTTSEDNGGNKSMALVILRGGSLKGLGTYALVHYNEIITSYLIPLHNILHAVRVKPLSDLFIILLCISIQLSTGGEQLLMKS